MICDPNDLKTDFYLLRDGPVVVTSDRAIWEGAAEWLTMRAGYKAHRWTLESEEAFYREVSSTFRWEEQFGYSPWNGNLDALNDGARAMYDLGSNRIVLILDNAERLKTWFGGRSGAFWDVLQYNARKTLIFGVGVIVLAHSRSHGEVARWAKADGVFELTQKTFHSQDFRDGV